MSKIKISTREITIIQLSKGNEYSLKNNCLVQGGLICSTNRHNREVSYNLSKNTVSIGCKTYSYNKLINFLEYLEGGELKEIECIVKKTSKSKSSSNYLLEKSSNFYINKNGKSYPKSEYTIKLLQEKPLLKFNKNQNMYDVNPNSYYDEYMSAKKLISFIKELQLYVEAVKKANENV